MKILLMQQFEEYLIFVYFISGIIALIAYLPQINSLFSSASKSEDVSIKTWLIWTIDNLISFLYAIYVLKDNIAILVMGIDFIGALTVLLLTAYNRYFRFRGQIVIVKTGSGIKQKEN